MRLGIMDSGNANTWTRDGTMTASYALARSIRADSFWLADHLNSLVPRAIWQRKYSAAVTLMPRVDACYEPWTALGHIAGRHRFGRMALGVGVTDSGRRNPAVTAQAAVSLQHFNKGGAILGIGPGEREGNEPYGVDWSAPVGRFEEAVATIRFLWEHHGEVVSRESPHFPLKNALFDLPPYRGAWPQIWIAGHGPRMLRITGRYADAWFPAFPHSSEDYATMLATVRDAAAAAGRDPSAITPAAWFLPFIGATRTQVDDILDSQVARSVALLGSAQWWRRHGAEHPLGPDFSGAQDFLPQLIDEETVLGLTRRVPESVLRSLVAGTPSEVVDQLAAWRDNGLQHCVLALGASQICSSTVPGMLTAFRPFFQAARGVRRL